MTEKIFFPSPGRAIAEASSPHTLSVLTHGLYLEVTAGAAGRRRCSVALRHSSRPGPAAPQGLCGRSAGSRRRSRPAPPRGPGGGGARGRRPAPPRGPAGHRRARGTCAAAAGRGACAPLARLHSAGSGRRESVLTDGQERDAHTRSASFESPRTSNQGLPVEGQQPGQNLHFTCEADYLQQIFH
ncbi:collagen, type I, alpha 1a-like [Prinia subflava]|uniref:collagen, type I, alpha 1a-like n=1 Tax=Prinia subflava TaxID=208062 RepID=UPI002FE3931C